MTKNSKRIKDIKRDLDTDKVYTLEEAVDILKSCTPTKFDQSIEISAKMTVDPRKADQLVRGTVSLPYGTGKTLRVLVLAKGDKVQEALDAGAEYAGSDEYITKIKDGWLDFDAVIATPDMMREVGKLGKILGPRGLMPTPKGGTVTMDVASTVGELKAGKIEFKVDKQAVINNAVGKLSFEASKLVENIKTFLAALWRAKPAAVKGQYVQSITISSTMGPGLKLEPREVQLKQ
ncbi:MAG: 50S ribosomal protein L1 [Chlamydiota bacterium]